jgi:hypothetical protein
MGFTRCFVDLCRFDLFLLTVSGSYLPGAGHPDGPAVFINCIPLMRGIVKYVPRVIPSLTS